MHWKLRERVPIGDSPTASGTTEGGLETFKLKGSTGSRLYFPDAGKKFVICQDARRAAVVTQAIRYRCCGVLGIAHPCHHLDRFTTM